MIIRKQTPIIANRTPNQLISKGLLTLIQIYTETLKNALDPEGLCFCNHGDNFFIKKLTCKYSLPLIIFFTHPFWESAINILIFIWLKRIAFIAKPSTM